jgi:hypothetical protein
VISVETPCRLLLPILVLLFAGLTVSLLLAGKAEEPVAVGAVVFPLSVKMESGRTLIAADPAAPTLLVLFSPQCLHCRRQIDLCARHAGSLEPYRVLFLSTGTPDRETSWNVEDHIRPLVRRVCATLDPATHLRLRGRQMLPVLLFVDRSGVVRERIAGETRIQKVLSVLENI